MAKIEDILEIPAYSMNKEEKSRWLTERLKQLSLKHRESCEEYSKILKAFNINTEEAESYYDLPFLPVRLFCLIWPVPAGFPGKMAAGRG